MKAIAYLKALTASLLLTTLIKLNSSWTFIEREILKLHFRARVEESRKSETFVSWRDGCSILECIKIRWGKLLLPYLPSTIILFSLTLEETRTQSKLDKRQFRFSQILSGKSQRYCLRTYYLHFTDLRFLFTCRWCSLQLNIRYFCLFLTFGFLIWYCLVVASNNNFLLL